VKRASKRWYCAAAVVLAVLGVWVWRTGAPVPSGAQIRRAHASAGVSTAPPAEVAGFPTTAQVLAAVAAAVNVTTLPKQPPKIAMDRAGCEAVFTAKTSPMCVYGDPKAARTIVLYGDSHDRMWIPAFNAMGRQLHWKVVQLTKSHCPVPNFFMWQEVLGRPYTECTVFHTFALDQIRALHPNIVVLSSMWLNTSLTVNGKPTKQGLDAAWSQGLATMIAKIKPLAGKVIVLGDIAYPKVSGDPCLAAHQDDVRPCNTLRVHAVYAAHNAMEQRVARQAGVSYVDTIPWFCTATVCPSVIGGLSVHWDAVHVASNYALWLSNALATAIGL